MIRFAGPAFAGVDDRLMALQLVKQGLTEAAMFTAEGEAVQWAEVLYKQPVLVQRGSFRPLTRATLEVLQRQERGRTLGVWRRHLSFHNRSAVLCSCEFQPGRFRKGQRVWGCGKARCYLCHGDKLLKQPTLQQRRANITRREWCDS